MPGLWFFDKLKYEVSQECAPVAVHFCHNSLDCTANELPEVSGHNPEGEIFSSRLGGSKRHDGSGLGNVPAPGANAVAERAKDEILYRKPS